MGRITRACLEEDFVLVPKDVRAEREERRWRSQRGFEGVERRHETPEETASMMGL